jgi:hypothetical protein
MVIGSLTTNIVADLSKWGPNLTKARGQLSTFSKSVSAATSKLGGLATAFAAGFSIKRIISTVDAMDDMADAAGRLGVSVQSFTSLDYAAKQLGSSTGALTAGFTKMLAGVGRSAPIFSQLGLDIGKLKSQSADQTFTDIADAISKLPTPAEKTAAAMAIFGKSGAGLLPMLNAGKDGIGGFAKEAQALGVAFDDMDASKIAEADAAFKSMAASIQGMVQSLTIALAPALTKAADGFSQIVTANKRFFGGTEKGPRQDFANNFVNKLSDQNVLDAVTATPLGEMDEFQRSAFQSRLDKIFEARNKPMPALLDKLPGMGMSDSAKLHTGVAQQSSLNGLLGMLPGGLQASISKARGHDLPAPIKSAFENIGGLIANGAGSALGMVGAGAAGVGSAFSGAPSSGALGQRLGPLDAISGGTREGRIASRENLRPRMNAPEEKTAKNTEKTNEWLEKIASKFGDGVEVLTGAFGG